MRRDACCASALAIFALTAHGEPASASASAAAPTAPAAPTASSSSAGPPESISHWWSFEKSTLLDSLGLDPEAGIFGLGLWRTTVDLRATGNLQSTTSPYSPDTEFYSYLTDEGITVHNDGWYVLDPRLLTGSASVRFGWQQAHQDAGNQGTAQDAGVTDYYLNISLLQEKPVNAMVQAAHSEFVTSHAGGGTTASSHSMQGATVSLREASILRDKEIAPYFSATLFGGHEDLQETTTNAGQQFQRDEQRDRVALDAHNGFETGDLTLALEQIDLTNAIYSSGSYRSRSADATYSLDFGKDLTRHSDAHIHWNERTGDVGETTLDFDEHLFFEHTAFLSSSLYYLLQDINSEAGSSRSQRIDGSAQYMPFLNVSTNLGATASRVEYDTGTIDVTGGYGGVHYNHWLPKGGVLSTSVSGSLEISDSNLSSAAVPTVNAPYQAPPELGAGASILLNETDVIASTIVVTDVRGGARLPTVLGADYLVEVEGNRTMIVPLATSAVIQGGDPLEISFTHLVDPSLKSKIDTQSYFISADWDWIGIALTHDITSQEPLSGQTQTLLSDQKRTALRIDVRHDWGNWRALANARAARYRDEHLNYDEMRLNENLTWRPSYNWQLALDASQTESKFLDSDRTSRNFDARLTGSWHSRAGWWTDGYVSWRTEQDSEMVDETITEGFFRVRRNFPQLALSFSVGVGQRERGPVQTTYENVQLNITRTF
jgi:hypothetical protein